VEARTIDVVSIDLNADVGEGFPDDAELIPLVTSVNVACGAHAGGPETIRRTIELAVAAGAAVGAHPSYPDREGFGRREMDLPHERLRASLVQQIRAVEAGVVAAGVPLRHVKPHGALYNRAARDPAVAALVAEAVLEVSPTLALVGLAGSASLTAARAVGLPAVAEAFADRRYEADGRLRDRRFPDALVDDPAAAGAQAVSIAVSGGVATIDGSFLRIVAESICVHGDQPGAAARARGVRAALERAGIELRPPGV
jgi:UPF0271 protein